MDRAGNSLNLTDLDQCSFAVSPENYLDFPEIDAIARRNVAEPSGTEHRLFRNLQFHRPIAPRQPISNSTGSHYINTTSISSSANPTPIPPSSSTSLLSRPTSDIRLMSSLGISVSPARTLGSLSGPIKETTTGATSGNESVTTQSSQVWGRCYPSNFTTIAVTTVAPTIIINNHSTQITTTTKVFSQRLTAIACESFATSSTAPGGLTPPPPSGNSQPQEGSSSGSEGGNNGSNGGAPEAGGLPQGPGEGSFLPNPKVTAVVLTAVTKTQAAVTLSSNLGAYSPKDVPNPIITEANNIAPDPTSQNPAPESSSPQADGSNAEGGISADGTTTHIGFNPQDSGQSQNTDILEDPSSAREVDGAQEQGLDRNQSDQNPSSPQTSNLPNPSLGSIVGAAIQELPSEQDSQALQNGQPSGTRAPQNHDSAGGSNNDPPSNSPQIVDVGGQLVSVGPAPTSGPQGVVIAGKAIQPGQATTINGVSLSVPTVGGNLIIGGTSTIALGQSVDDPSTQVLDIGGSQVSAAPASRASTGAVVVAGETVQPGQVTTINGVAVSIPPAGYGLVIGGTTTVNFHPNGSPTAALAVTVGGETILANPSGAFVLAPGITLSPGGAAVTVADTTLSLAPEGTIAVINGITQTLAPNLANPTIEPVLTIGNTIITANVVGSSTAFVFGPGQTLTPGGNIVVFGTTFSLPSTGSAIIVNGQTLTLGVSTPQITAAPVLTVNGQAITGSIFGSGTAFILGPGTTLTPGASVIISRTTYSLPYTTSGVVIINGQTSTLGLATVAPDLTIDGQTITPMISNGQTSYVLGPGTTLTPGGIVTISGTRISLDSSGTALVFGSSTSAIPMTPASAPASTTLVSSTTVGPGGAIVSGLDATGTHTHKGETPGSLLGESILVKVVISVTIGILAASWGCAM